ncbi:MAG: helix-turn-helix transcriptional regulator [Bacteroidales bacterium]|nr:helix-turn-helix transcriptional regulator [Bacteroidales bacterium]
MEKLPEIQKAIFEEVKSRLPANVSFVHEISELLKVSYDSAYRRIRGERMLSLEDLYLICSHFGVSIDPYFGIKGNKVVFDSMFVEPEQITIKDWLKRILSDIKRMAETENTSIIYSAKDIPFFHFFQIPEIAAFKVFFWQKTLFRFPEYINRKFSFSEYDKEINDIGTGILLNSIKIPTREIWNEDTFAIFLRQIEFYWISGLFENTEDIWLLCDKVEQWVRHLQYQAEHGFKFIYGQDPSGVEDSFKLYENEVVLNDNTILANLNSKKITYLTYNVVSLLVTADPAFCESIDNHLSGLIKKSIRISSSAAKERSRFFNRLINQIRLFREKVKKDMT